MPSTYNGKADAADLRFAKVVQFVALVVQLVGHDGRRHQAEEAKQRRGAGLLSRPSLEWKEERWSA